MLKRTFGLEMRDVLVADSADIFPTYLPKRRILVSRTRHKVHDAIYLPMADRRPDAAVLY